MSISLQQLYQLIQQHRTMAATSTDIIAYAESVAKQLTDSVSSVTTCKVIIQPQENWHQIVIADEPYAALNMTLLDAAVTWPLVQIWGDSVTRAWQQHDLQLTQDLIVQQQTADVLLRNLPLRSDINTMLQTAAEAIGRLLGASAVNIYIKPDTLSSIKDSE